jgi:hypothetical protein
VYAVEDYFLRIDGIPGESPDAECPERWRQGGVREGRAHRRSRSGSRSRGSTRPTEANGALGAPISAGWDRSKHAEV